MTDLDDAVAHARLALDLGAWDLTRRADLIDALIAAVEARARRQPSDEEIEAQRWWPGSRAARSSREAQDA